MFTWLIPLLYVQLQSFVLDIPRLFNEFLKFVSSMPAAFPELVNSDQISVFFQAEDGIRDSVASRGLGDVYKRQLLASFKELILLLSLIHI